MTYPDTQAPPTLDRAAIALARKWALIFESKGLRVLPSDPTKKKPLCRFAHLWEGGGPSVEWLWERFPTSNLQIMTGRFWSLGVIDLDGPDAFDALMTLDGASRLPETWTSASGGGGRHLWFTLPSGPPLPKRVIWKGEEKHSAVEFLGDRSLVMAPPSIHPKTGKMYRFVGRITPLNTIRPAMIPWWLLRLVKEDPKAVDAPSRPAPVLGPLVPKGPVSPLQPGVRRDDVLAAIPDKIAVARSWGVRVVDQSPGTGGWVDCHDFNREDRHPSARFHPETGSFWRPGERPMSLFDLGVARGCYATWLDCCADLAATYMPQPKGGARCLR